MSTVTTTAVNTAAVPVSPTVMKALRWVEWLLLIDCAIQNPLSIGFNAIPWAPWQLSAFILVIGTLSLELPTHRSLWQRRAYITVEFLLLLALGFQLNLSTLFELFIIKACLLLPRRDVIISTATATALFFIEYIFYLPTALNEVRDRGIEPYLNSQRILLDNLVSSIAVATFVILLGFVFAAEQRGRRRAEVLATEVEALATKLERSRIARDIHDSLSHSLTTLDVQLALAERYNQEGAQAKLQEAISTSQQLAAQCLAEARQSLHTMRDSSFDLESSLGTLSKQLRSSFVIQLQVNLPPLPQKLSYQLYLITKEGLVNVQKHAQATQVTLSIVSIGKCLVLDLADNGDGFEIKQTTEGYGLRGIRERSQLLGGQLTVKSKLGQGTQLQLTVPLE